MVVTPDTDWFSDPYFSPFFKKVSVTNRCIRVFPVMGAVLTSMDADLGLRNLFQLTDFLIWTVESLKLLHAAFIFLFSIIALTAFQENYIWDIYDRLHIEAI
jgi:hypothetical protein